MTSRENAKYLAVLMAAVFYRHCLGPSLQACSNSVTWSDSQETCGDNKGSAKFLYFLLVFTRRYNLCKKNLDIVYRNLTCDDCSSIEQEKVNNIMGINKTMVRI